MNLYRLIIYKYIYNSVKAFACVKVNNYLCTRYLEQSHKLRLSLSKLNRSATTLLLNLLCNSPCIS